jgi:CDP-glucose 4,6-dehydratase
MFDDCYRGKTVLVTGHTGFKGSWLTTWLLKLGARVVGISRDVPTSPSLFQLSGLTGQIDDVRQDVRDVEALGKAVAKARPDFVFHLAAQPLVSQSYADPVETYTSNIIGTLGVLEALRHADWPCVAVMITSDKCYDNVEWVWGYRETDALGGKDVYSGSKGAAELVIKSMFYSFFSKGSPVKIGIGRAGNVIGGGDWARDRIVVDAMRSWTEGSPVTIRSPNATRPWQHVLEPLSGYLRLGQNLQSGATSSGEAFNFGPNGDQNRTVAQLLDQLHLGWGNRQDFAPYLVADNPMHEAGLLKLNCDKALYELDWTSTLDFAETAEITTEWYYEFYKRKAEASALTDRHIERYLSSARMRNQPWLA